jgi:outer membrane protein assembly factor BamB
VQYTSPAVVDGTIYFANNNGELHVIDATTREQRWTRRLTRTAAFFSSPTVAGGTVYVTDTDGTLYALDVASGDILWQLGVRSLLSSPAVIDGMIYIGSERGQLYALGDAVDVWPSSPPASTD